LRNNHAKSSVNNINDLAQCSRADADSLSDWLDNLSLSPFTPTVDTGATSCTYLIVKGTTRYSCDDGDATNICRMPSSAAARTTDQLRRPEVAECAVEQRA
jgi:hypothetical protein